MIIVYYSIKKYNPLLLPCPFCPTERPAESNLHLANSLATAVREPDLYRLLTFQVPNFMSLFRCLARTKVSVEVRGVVCEYFVTGYVFTARSC